MLKTKPKLPFLVIDWKNLKKESERILNNFNASKNVRNFIKSIEILSKTKKVQLFQLGTCKGVWYPEGSEYRILFVFNTKKGNGHFNDVLERFETSCKREDRILVFEEVINEELAKHLIEKRGFVMRGSNCIKNL